MPVTFAPVVNADRERCRACSAASAASPPDLIVSECTIRRECERPFGTAQSPTLTLRLSISLFGCRGCGVDDHAGAKLHISLAYQNGEWSSVDLLEPIDSAIRTPILGRIGMIQFMPEVHANALVPIAARYADAAFSATTMNRSPESGARGCPAQSALRRLSLPIYGGERSIARRAPGPVCGVESGDKHERVLGLSLTVMLRIVT